MYGYEDQGNDHQPGSRVAIVIAVLVAAAAIGWFGVRQVSDDDSTVPVTILPANSAAPTSPVISSSTTSTSVAATTTARPTTTTTARTTTTAERTTTTSTAAKPTTTTSTASTRSTTTSSTSTEPSQPQAESYPTLPDGSPEPVLAIFDVDTVTLSGNVPSEADRERAKQLAKANHKNPDARVVDELTINPRVPENIGARVIELTSVRFPEGSAEILAPHAVELDRVAVVMDALPRVTVLVIGHADQRGDETLNFALSEQRAQAVVTYLVGRGIAPSRLSARAVGESDLLSIDDDEASLALNRRTEFVFNGLLLQ